MHALFQLAFGILFQDTPNLFCPSNDCTFEQRNAVFACVWPVQINGRHWKSSFALDLSANNSGAGQERVEPRSEEHTSELQSLMRISYAVFCLKKKIKDIKLKHRTIT